MTRSFCLHVFRCLSLPVMLRAVLSKAAAESTRRPASQPVLRGSLTPPATTIVPPRTPLTSPSATVASSVCQPSAANTPPPKSAAPSERGQHNPMLTSLLESDARTPSADAELFDSLQQKKTSAADITAMKRQSSVDEVFSAGAASSRPAAPFHVNATPPISRSYSVPTPASFPRPPVKLEPVSSLSFSSTKPLMSAAVEHGRTFSTPRSSTSELVNLLSSDDFVGSTGTSDLSAENQYFNNGSSKSLPNASGPTSGRSSAVSMDWSNSSGMDWETCSTTPDDLRQKSSASKNNQMMRNSLPSGGIKTEPTLLYDDTSAGLVAVQDKPPITVKLSRRVLKPSSQRRSTPEYDSATDRAAIKERAKLSQGPKLNSFDLLSAESLDFEVDSLTSAVVSVASSSPGRLSTSPRLPDGGTGPLEILKIGDKRPRVGGNKLIGTPVEKKQRRNDEGRKMSRKIYDFEEDSDVFVSSGSQSGTGKISTIKITKSEGRLQIQKTGAVVSPGSRPVHKSVSSASGQVSGSAVRLGRPPGFPLRPVVRSKSLVTPKSDSKAAGLPVARMKSSPTVVSSGGIMPTTSSYTKPAVANAAKSSVSSAAAVTKPKSLQPVAKRKGSLSAVIEKLSKGVSAGAEADKKVLYDDVRLAIIREGNKPSTPTREMSSSSSLNKSSISSTKRPENVKESSVRLTVPVRKPPVSSGSQVVDVSRSQAGMVRFTAPPASPPSAVNEQRMPHSLQSNAQLVPKIPREQADKQPVGNSQSVHPNSAVSWMSEVEVIDAASRGSMTQQTMRMIRPPVSCTAVPTKSSPASGETITRTKTPDAVLGRAVDPTFMQSVETSEEISDRLHTARHFMDAMARSSRVCDSNVVVERRLSPPQSPSPPTVPVQPGTLDLTKPTIIDTHDSYRASSELMSSVTGSVSSKLEPSSLPVDLSADSGIVPRQSDTSAVRFRTPSDVSLRSNSTRSPSGTGSPVASLIIDCFPGSPVLLCSSNAASSPVTTLLSDSAASVPSDTDDTSRVDLCHRQSISPVMSVGETATSDIDDDLMNEALIMSADISNDHPGKL